MATTKVAGLPARHGTEAGAKKFQFRILAYLILVLLLIILVVPRYSELLDGLAAIKNADIKWIIGAVLLTCGTYFAGAFTYKVLSFKKLKYGRTTAVELAASFVNRLLPGGIGGISVNVIYLLQSGLKADSAASVTAMNGVIAFASHIALIAVALSISNKSFSNLFEGQQLSKWSILSVILIVLLIFGVLIYLKPVRSRVNRIAKGTIKKIILYYRSPGRILLAFISASVLTLLFVGAFYTCAHSVGIDISFIRCFIIYTLGVVAGQAFLTPGGIGGVEAGMVASSAAYGIGTSEAISAVIIYRLITFWLPLVPGYLSLHILRKRGHLSIKKIKKPR